MIRRACTLDDLAYLLVHFTPAQARRVAFLRWAVLEGRLGEWPAPTPDSTRSGTEKPWRAKTPFQTSTDANNRPSRWRGPDRGRPC